MIYLTPREEAGFEPMGTVPSGYDPRHGAYYPERSSPMQLHEALEVFRDRVLGTTIRGQKVDGVELVIDTLGERPHGLRFILFVLFTDTILPQDMTKEERLLARVFDERPGWARIAMFDVDELRGRLLGEIPCLEAEWGLQDELHLKA